METNSEFIARINFYRILIICFTLLAVIFSVGAVSIIHGDEGHILTDALGMILDKLWLIALLIVVLATTKNGR